MSSWDIVHRWYMPFIWVALSSLVAVPVSIYFQFGMPMHPGAELGLPYGESWVLRDDFLETIIVHLLGLGVAIWLLDPDGSTRWAALWGLTLAVAQMATPIALVTLSDVPMTSGQHYIDWETLRIVIWFADFQLFAMGLMVWSIFSRFVGSEQSLGHAVHAEAY